MALTLSSVGLFLNDSSSGLSQRLWAPWLEGEQHPKVERTANQGPQGGEIKIRTWP